jgi:hypothetical protein
MTMIFKNLPKCQNLEFKRPKTHQIFERVKGLNNNTQPWMVIKKEELGKLRFSNMKHDY